MKPGEMPIIILVAVGQIQVGTYRNINYSLRGIDRTNRQITFEGT